MSYVPVPDAAFQLVIARKNGKVQFMSPEDGSITREFRDENVCVGPKKEGTFIGLSVKDE
jgi:hypothetical protein